VGRGGALGALDQGWEAAAAAVDGEQKLRRRSGEVESLGKEMAVEMQMRESKSECVGSFRTCSGSRRRLGSAGAGAGMPAGCVAARAAAAATWRGGEGASAWRGAAARVLGRHMAQGAVARVWQNSLNYSSSSVLVIVIPPILTQRTSNGTTHWSFGSPPEATTVQQDRSRFTSHEGEFTIT
jgi:hypothetical protein